MNLLMKCDKVNENILNSLGKSVTNFEILSQILPALTLKYTSSLFNSDENKKESNNVLEIKMEPYIEVKLKKEFWISK